MAKPNLKLPHLSEQDIGRFWASIDQGFPGECWPWTGHKIRSGYGHFYTDGRIVKAHRVAYFLYYGVDPGDKLVCHTCDNPPCCNPLHHFLGSPKDNSNDMMQKGRHARCGPKNPACGDRNGSRKYPERLAWGDKNWTRRHPERLKRGDNNTSRSKPENLARGCKNGNSRLTEEKVRAIRRMYGTDHWTLCKLAAHFGVSKSTISYIVRGETWKHITE